MAVAWQDVGQTEEPGTFPFEDGSVMITEQELRTWRDHPHATFTATRLEGTSGPPQYVLGDYELPEDPA